MKYYFIILASIIFTLAPSIPYFNFIYNSLLYINTIYFSLLLSFSLFLRYQVKILPFTFSIIFGVFFIGFFLNLFVNYSIYDPRTINELYRFISWFLSFYIFMLFFSDLNMLISILNLSSRILTLFIVISYLYILYYGLNSYFVIIQENLSKYEGVALYVKDYRLNADYYRFTLPGINSNTLCALSSIFSGYTLWLIFEKRGNFRLNLFCLYVLISSVLITYSRSGQVFLLIVFISFFVKYKKRILQLILIPLILTIGFLPVIFYRFLNLVDALFQTSYSQDLTSETSERSQMAQESLNFLSTNYFGMPIDVIAVRNPLVAGEHNSILYLSNIFGITVGLAYLALHLVFIRYLFKLYKIGTLFSDNFNILFMSIYLILVFSMLFSPAYYLNLIFLGPVYYYFHNLNYNTGHFCVNPTNIK